VGSFFVTLSIFSVEILLTKLKKL